jgi:hypothetical protein
MLWWDGQTSKNEKLVSLGIEKQIRNGKTIYMGFVNKFFWWLPRVVYHFQGYWLNKLPMVHI